MGLERIPADIEEEIASRKQGLTHGQTFTLTFTPMGNLELLVFGRRRAGWEENTATCRP